MTKRELVLFLRDLEKVRKMLTPAQAAQVPNLFPKVKERSKPTNVILNKTNTKILSLKFLL